MQDVQQLVIVTHSFVSLWVDRDSNSINCTYLLCCWAHTVKVRQNVLQCDIHNANAHKYEINVISNCLQQCCNARSCELLSC
jgi:hypothetical protein